MKTLIYTTAVNTINRTVKDTEIFDVTRRTWEHYCKRHNMDFYVIDTPPLKEDTPPHWFRYWIFDLKPNYDRYMYIDTDIMAKWDAPNIFEQIDDKFVGWPDLDNLKWVYQSIEGYKPFFEFELDNNLLISLLFILNYQFATEELKISKII